MTQETNSLAKHCCHRGYREDDTEHIDLRDANDMAARHHGDIVVGLSHAAEFLQCIC